MISYGQLIFLAVCVWVVCLLGRANAQHGEEIRRYEEKYPLGYVKSEYEKEGTP